MIACACGNDNAWMNGQLNVNVFAFDWMSEWSVDQMTVIVLHSYTAMQNSNFTSS